LAKRLLEIDTVPIKPLTSDSELKSVVVEQKDVFAAIVEGMRKTSPNQRGKPFF
jgi:hypothetical protein